MQSVKSKNVEKHSSKKPSIDKLAEANAVDFSDLRIYSLN